MSLNDEERITIVELEMEKARRFHLTLHNRYNIPYPIGKGYIV